MNALTPIVALNESQLLSRVPSIFAQQAHHSRSDRYGYVNSLALIRALVENGFAVFDARQSKAKAEDKREFTKHIVRLRHLASFERTQQLFAEGKALWNDTHTIEARTAARAIPGYGELTFTNSHDGSSAVLLGGGILNPDCFNGLFVSDTLIETIHVTHSKRLVANVIDGAFTVVEQLPKAIEVAGAWSQLQLNEPEKQAFAEAARVLRFADAEGNVASTVTAQQLLNPRRAVDAKDNLWKVFNRVQENVIRGGLDDVRPATEAAKEKGHFTPRRLKTRAINGIDQDTRLNKALWTLAEKLAEAKAA